ncbi:hypothetical protein DH2020_039691 [Rehmannia glutinosa]|uniref:UBA domain-containing protein n=1 Tax=Rehmannia glutinosa TaxID=99300 RepID=A0ABR0UWZ6_REHGL
MRSNIVSEASLPTRLNQWWEGIPFLTSAVVVVCGIIYFVCLLVGYDSFVEVCFLPSAVVSHFQVYRIYTAILFHGSLLHVLFNMLALVPMGSELERIMGSIRLLYIIILLATSNAIIHLVIALLVAYNPFHFDGYFMDQCSIGFSGILFSMIVIETSLSGVQSRRPRTDYAVAIFARYVWILLAVFQLLMTNISFLGHLCGILSGYAYTFGLFNVLIPGTSFYSSIESSSWIWITFWKHVEESVFLDATKRKFCAAQDSDRFPGRGRSLGSSTNQAASLSNSDSSLQTRLLDDGNNLDQSSHPATIGGGQRISDGRPPVVNSAVMPARTQNQGAVASEEEVQKLLAMGFDKTQVEVAMAAADGDLNVAVEILMSQQKTKSYNGDYSAENNQFNSRDFKLGSFEIL